MSTPRKAIANLYLYDPLDRLTGAHSAQRFYNGTRLATEIQGHRSTCFFEHDATPLAELHSDDGVTLLATDLQTSVLHGVSPAISQPQSYDPYGHRPTTNGLLNLLGFNGERPDPMTGHYLLGQGYRAFNLILMRFNSPDSLSPFGRGGVNCYAYCQGNPINNQDPSGHISFKTMALVLLASRRFKRSLFTRIEGPITWRKLRNRKILDLEQELDFTRRKIKDETAQVSVVTGKESLSGVSDERTLHKFVLTQDQKFIMGSFPAADQPYPSHASFAEIGSQNPGASNNVIGAGYIFKDKGHLYIKNYSGHYRPNFNQLRPVEDHLQGLGIQVKSVRNDYVVKPNDPL